MIALFYCWNNPAYCSGDNKQPSIFIATDSLILHEFVLCSFKTFSTSCQYHNCWQPIALVKYALCKKKIFLLLVSHPPAFLFNRWTLRSNLGDRERGREREKLTVHIICAMYNCIYFKQVFLYLLSITKEFQLWYSYLLCELLQPSNYFGCPHFPPFLSLSYAESFLRWNDRNYTQNSNSDLIAELYKDYYSVRFIFNPF